MATTEQIEAAAEVINNLYGGRFADAKYAATKALEEADRVLADQTCPKPMPSEQTK